MESEIITIGDEILIGQIVDTNSAWMARKLNEEGIYVRQINSISDDPGHIEEVLFETGKRVHLVLITGGLGPTRDDRTKTAICNFFGTTLVEDPEVLRNIINLWGIELSKLNRDQALVPESATVLPNTMGTAPCLWLNKGGCVYIFMPGVPFEMKNLMEKEVIPRIRKEFNTSPILHRTIQVYGLAESILAEKISEWETNLFESLKLAYLPGPEGIKLRLSARGEDRQMLEHIINKSISELSRIIPQYIIGYEDDSIAAVVGRLLKEKNLTISTAESCTGGYIAHSITSIPGSSEYFKGSIIPYSNELKTKILGISEAVIKLQGAVSKDVVEAMAVNTRKLLGTDYAISTSGIAGPTGGTETKPVGTVWIAIAGPDIIISKIYNFGNKRERNRERNIIRSSQTALNMLRLILLERLKAEGV